MSVNGEPTRVSHEFVKKNMVRYMRPHWWFAYRSCEKAALTLVWRLSGLVLHFHTYSARIARFGLLCRNILFLNRASGLEPWIFLSFCLMSLTFNFTTIYCRHPEFMLMSVIKKDIFSGFFMIFMIFFPSDIFSVDDFSSGYFFRGFFSRDILSLAYPGRLIKL